ncbi:MAG TPA: lysylphosphatidylglycerol synthase transmembrane domain-containing protein [Longimicrobiales bacterium]|nr:lysylphosphatidylglycerol synthase transmembrane domain-containing protein [Longimicrobiales bacterium]
MTVAGRRAARVAVSAGLLAAVALVLDPRTILGRLGALDPRWVAAALALSVVQVTASAWRWRYTARRVGVDLRLSRAVAEYYLAGFVNQLLPGGVAGDVSRAWRHARAQADDGAPEGRGRVVNVVILERASGQVAMTAVALASVAVLLWGAVPWWGALAGAAACVPAAWVATRLWLRLRRVPVLAAFARDARAAFLGPGALPVQLGVSLGIVATYLAMYLAGAAALGVEAPLGELAPLVAPVLVTMLLPVSVAGWGVREAAAAALWSAVGLAPADGVAISVAYGLLVLVSTLPGAVVLALTSRGRKGPRRRAGPHPA